MRRNLILAALALVAAPLVVQAQSLADVARAEQARRKAVVAQPAKVYTNDNLKPAESAGQPAAVGAPALSTAAAASATPPQGPAPSADTTQKDEKYWRDRITTARATLDHDKVLVDAVQSRINALTTDFVNTSDPAQRALVETNRNTAIAELARLNKDIQTQTKAVSDIQEEARRASVPAGWLR
jgi:hypothetical protein